MLRLTIFLILLWGCLSLDINGSLVKKYAFMKIMSGCLGEDFVMMIKQQMMKACGECHTRDTNVTHQHNFDYLMNHFRSSQLSIPMSPLTQNNPLPMYQPFVYPVFIQSPYNVPSFPQFPTHHHDPQQYNPFSHYHAADFSGFPNSNAPQFPAQHHDSQQYDTFPHHHAPDFNTFPNSHAPHDHNVHYQLPTMHQYNVPNIPVEHYHTSAVSQYDLNNLHNIHGLTDEHHLNSKFKEHKHDHIGKLNIQGHPSIHNDAQNPVLPNVQLQAPISSNQLGYPQKEHHERQFFELNPQPVDPQKRKKRSLPFAPDDLETMKGTLSSKIRNMTCVFREMGWLTEENDVNFTFIGQQIKSLNLNMKLQDDLQYSHDICKDVSMCMPTEKAKHPLMREMGGALSYMKCMSMKAVTACMKNDFRIYQAKMGYGSSDNDLPMEIDNLLKTQNSNPSQLADDIGSLMFTDAAEMPCPENYLF